MTNFRIGDKLHITKEGLARPELNKILTALAGVSSRLEDFAVKHWVTYSPLLDIHDTSVVAGISDVDSQETSDDEGINSYSRFVPAAGTVKAYDLTHTTVGTIPNTAFQHSERKFAGGCKFDGNFNFKIDNDALFNVTDKIAIGGWIKPQAFTGSEQVIFIKDSQYKMVINANSNTIEASVFISGSFGTPVTYTYTPGTFIDVWMDWDGTTLELWVGGTLEDSESRSGTLNTTTNDFAFGGTPAGGSRVANNTVMSWWTAVNESVANVSNWLTNHVNGILNTSEADEITTMPLYMEKPMPDAHEGLFVG